MQKKTWCLLGQPSSRCIIRKINRSVSVYSVNYLTFKYTQLDDNILLCSHMIIATESRLEPFIKPIIDVDNQIYIWDPWGIYLKGILNWFSPRTCPILCFHTPLWIPPAKPGIHPCPVGSAFRAQQNAHEIKAQQCLLVIWSISCALTNCRFRWEWCHLLGVRS